MLHMTVGVLLYLLLREREREGGGEGRRLQCCISKTREKGKTKRGREMGEKGGGGREGRGDCVIEIWGDRERNKEKEGVTTGERGGVKGNKSKRTV